MRLCRRATHRRRIEARMRRIEGMAEITWARVEQRRAGYERLDRCEADPGYIGYAERLLAEAIGCA